MSDGKRAIVFVVFYDFMFDPLRAVPKTVSYLLLCYDEGRLWGRGTSVDHKYRLRPKEFGGGQNWSVVEEFVHISGGCIFGGIKGLTSAIMANLLVPEKCKTEVGVDYICWICRLVMLCE